nr:BTAD domain-containing putative transcriptional regulator [Streptomyces sp. HNM0574]
MKAAHRGESVRISSGQQRTLLATLLLHANEVVSQDQLVDVLWDERPPRNAHTAVRTYVMRLRQSLGSVLGARVLTRAGGYLVQAEPDEIDLLHCGRLHRSAQTAVRADHWIPAERDLRTALALWRGEPLVDVASQRLRDQELPTIEQLRLDVLELHYDVQLALGAHQEVLRELQSAVDRYPLRERFCVQLMTALHHAGRRSDALDAYRETGRRLAEELGIDPGQEMRRLQQQILTDTVPEPRQATTVRRPGSAEGEPEAREPAPDRPREQAPWDGPPGEAARDEEDGSARREHPEGRAYQDGRDGREDGEGPGREETPRAVGRHGIVPRQLPVATSHFTGREAELRMLDEIREVRRDPRQGAVVVPVVGIGGIGKTALAVHWAHRVAGEFPDGQLFVDLHGFDPTGVPLAPSLAVRRLLDAFEVPEERIPADFEAQCALYRSVLVDRRVLLVLDNARDEEQIRPLLPAGSGCMVVVTSRQQLPGLLMGDAGQGIHLDLLSKEETRSLCERVLGPERFAGTDEFASTMIELCGRMPLTTRILLASATAQPRLSLREVIGHFEAVPSRLDRFETGDTRTSVRTALVGSYRNLSPVGARLFRALGLYRGGRVSLRAAAALVGAPASDTYSAVSELARHHLVTLDGPGRYAMHDIVREYALEQARRGSEETAAGEGGAAVERLLAYYLHSAQHAATLADPAAAQHCGPLPEPCPREVPVECFPDATSAREWFVRERHAMLAHLAHAREDGFPRFSWLLAERMAVFLRRSGHWQEWAYAARCAMAAAVAEGDSDEGEAPAQLQLGWATDLTDRGPAAHTHLLRALELYHRLGDADGQARARLRLARFCGRREQEDDFRSHVRGALALFRETGDRDGEAETLNTFGWYCTEFGDHDTAVDALGRALQLYRELDNRHGEADVWDSLAWAHHRAGAGEEARRCYLRAIELDASLDQLGSRNNQAQTLVRCGELHLSLGDRAATAEYWRRAIRILDELGLPEAESLRARTRVLEEEMRPATVD